MLNNPTEDAVIDFLLTQGLNDTTIHKKLNELLISYNERISCAKDSINKELIRDIKSLLFKKEYEKFEKDSKVSRLTKLEKDWNKSEQRKNTVTSVDTKEFNNRRRFNRPIIYDLLYQQKGIKYPIDRDMAFEILYDADDNIMGFSELDPKTLEISDGTKWIQHNGDRIMKRVLGYDQVIYLSSYMNKELDTALDDALLKEIDKQKEKEFFDNKDSALNIPISQLKRKKPFIKEMPPFNGSSEFDSKLFDALHKKDNTIIVKPNSGIIHTGPIGDYNTSFYDSKLNNTKSFNQNEINCLLK